MGYRRCFTRRFIVALLSAALVAGMLFVNTTTAHAEGWEKIYKMKSGHNVFVYALSYKGTFIKGKRIRGIFGVKTPDSSVKIPGKVKGMKVMYVELSDTHFDYDSVNVKTSTKNIKSINLKDVTELRWFYLYGPKVTKLDFSKNKKLKYVYIGGVKSLKSMNLTKSTKLTTLSIADAKSLKSITLSKNTKLTMLSISGAKSLKSINLSKNTKLTTLSILGAKSLKSIDLSKNKKLESITLNKGIKVKGLSKSKYERIVWAN
jgi:hypothetical protein